MLCTHQENQFCFKFSKFSYVFSIYRQIQSDNVHWMDIKMSSSGRNKNNKNLFEWIFIRYIKIELNMHKKWFIMAVVVVVAAVVAYSSLCYNLTFFSSKFSDGTFLSPFTLSHLWNEKFTNANFVLAPLFVGLNYLFFSSDSDSLHSSAIALI